MATGAPYRDNPFETSELPAPHRLTTLGSAYSSSSDAVNHVDQPYGQGVYLPTGAGAPRTFGSGPAQYSPMPSANYAAAGRSQPRSSTWLQQEQSSSRRTRWIIIGVIAVVVAIAVAVAVGVTVSQNHQNQNLSSGNSPAGSGSGSNSSVVVSDPSDPSNFEKNATLKNAFYGIAYTPVGAILPNCSVSQADVITDIQLMSQITDRVRLYGADCNVSEIVLNAIALTKVNMQVYLGNYIDITDDTAYTRQKAEIELALQKFGTSNVFGVTVGNEVMLDFCTDNGLADASNDTAVAPAVAYITAKIADTRSSLQALGYTNLQVGNSDAGDYFNHQVLEVCDYGLANVHPWFAQVDISQAAAWTYDFFENTNIAQAAATTRQPTMYIAETGWPTASDDAASASDGAPGPGGLASVPNLQTFLETFVCQSNTNGTKYFFFEFFDEEWKAAAFGGVEAHWGLFDVNKNLKAGLTIPDCTHQ